MEQLELPGMPSPTRELADGSLQTREHLTVKLYPPDEERPTWFTLVGIHAPGDNRLISAEHTFFTVPAVVVANLSSIMLDYLEAADPF